MKNNKAQIQGVGMLVIAAVAVIVGLVLFQAAAQKVGDSTNTYQATNASFTMPANGTTADLTPCGQGNTSAVVIMNASTNVTVTAGNYTISKGIGSDGYINSRIYYNGVGNNYYGGYAVNVTCTYEPKGYINDTGGRAIAGIIILLSAIAIAVVLLPLLRQDYD